MSADDRFWVAYNQYIPHNHNHPTHPTQTQTAQHLNSEYNALGCPWMTDSGYPKINTEPPPHPQTPTPTRNVQHLNLEYNVSSPVLGCPRMTDLGSLQSIQIRKLSFKFPAILCVYISPVGSCIWLFIATWFRIPVSATHSIVGASLGFHMVVFGDLGVNWRVVVLISKYGRH